MNNIQVHEESTLIDNVRDRIPSSPIVCPEAVPPNAADLLESLSEAIFTLDEQWRFTYMNARAETLMRRPRTELLGRNIWQECPEAAESAFHRELERAMAGKEAIAFEAFSLYADAWLAVRVSPLPSGLSVLLQDITARKVAETERQERASIVEASFDAVIGKTLEGIITSWNPSAVKLYGYTEQEAVGKHISLLIPPERAAELPLIMAQLHSGERIEAFETVRRHKNGSDVFVSQTISPICDTHGKIVGSSHIVRDITERKQAEEAKEIAGKRLRFATESGEIGGWEYKIGDGTLVWDERMMQIYDFTPETFPGAYTAWSERLHPEDKERAEAALQQAICDDKKFDTEFRILLPSGQIRYIKANALLLKDENGVPVQLIGLNQDVTENRRIERALEQSEQEQRQLAEHLAEERARLAEAQEIAKVGSWELNLTTNTRFWSEETYRIYGVDPSRSGASYEAFQERVHLDDRTAVETAYKASIANHDPYALDHRMQMADGSIKIVHQRYKTEYDASGQPIRCIGTVQDVTEQKQTEQKLTRSLDLLRAVTEGTTDAIFAKDVAGRYLTINAAGARLVGKTSEEIIGQDDTYIFSPESARMTMEIDRQVLESGEACELESEGVVGGVARTYHSTRGPLRDHSGNIIGVVGISRDITEKKQAEQTLHHILDGANCLLWQAEVEETGTEWLRWKGRFSSEQAAQHFLPLHLPAGRSYAEAWSLARMTEDREHSDRYGAQEIRAGRGYQQEFRCHSKDGALHWIAENVSVQAVGEGKWRCTGVCTDVTERKLAEEATRAMIRGAQCLLWYATVEEQPHGLQWYIETQDAEAAQQFFPLVQPPGVSYTEAWTRSRLPEDSDLMNAQGNGALLGGEKGYTQQFRCRRADGEWRWLSETVRIEALAPGRWRCVGVCTDVTEQKQAEEERDRFFTLSLDLLCVVDTNGYFTRLNPAFETVLGYAREELMARPILDFVHPDDREATVAQVEKVSTGERNLHFENRYLCRDGSYRWLAWTSIAFEGFRYGAAHDITSIKEAEAALRRVNEELEARVLRRTAQITEANAQMLAAKNEADRANLAKSEFLSRMSHELRTPLNAILGFGQILDKEALTPFQQESIGYILKGGRHLLDLINEVLDIARVEAGHINLSLEPIALLEDIRETCDLVRPLALENSILLTIDADSLGGSYVQADRQRFKQVLLNLLSNAIKYNFKGGQTRIYGAQRSQDRYCIAIEDTGPGLTEEEQQRLFTPFERLNAANSGVEGTGLGLVLTQRLVTAMGGSLTLESLPGKGTTFFVELGLVPAPVEILAGHPLGAYEPQTDPPEKPNATILYIEDNLSNMRLLEVLLRSRPGTTLLPAMQGSVGLDLARQHEPDLILLDLHLPDISGTEVLARLQHSALTCDIPVVILSADATSSQIERLLLGGARAYLTKPLDITEFLHTLDTLLPARHADGSSDMEAAT